MLAMKRLKCFLIMCWILVYGFLSIPSFAGTTQYSYDSLNRLIKVEHADGTTIEYTYDEAGNRLSKKTTMSNLIPNIPSNPSPSDSAAGVPLNAILSWTGGDSDAGDTVTYDVYWGTANPPVTKASSNQSETSVDPGSLTPGTTYYWKIVAKNQHGASIEGPIWNFTTAVKSTADLSLTLSDSPDPVSIGTNLTFALGVTNSGPDEATAVTLSDPLPAGTTFVSATASQGSCTQSAGMVVCNLGALASGASASVSVVVSPTVANSLTNTAVLAAHETDPNPTNNTASAATTVSRLPTVTLVATDPQASEQVGNRGQFTVYRTGDTSKYLTVKYTVSGTAANGTDYARLPGSVTIPARSASAAVSVSPVNDALFEGDETVLLSLQPNASYLMGTPNSATVVIADNDLPAVTITATDGAAKEAGQDPGQLRIVRTGSTLAPLVVYYTVSGTATGGSDYLSLSGSLNFAAGVSSETLAISPLDDQEYEGSETVVVTLVANLAYTLGSSKSATVTLADDDLPVVTVAATDSQASEPGTDKGQFTISRTGNTGKSLTVKYTLSGTAINGTDYTGLWTTVTLAAGRSSATITVAPRDDRIKEGEETVQLTVAPGTSYRVGAPESAVVSIADND